MKHLKIILFVFLAIFAVNNSQAQDENNPWLLGLGTNAVDFFPTNHPSIINANGDRAGWFAEFGNLSHYNFIASPISKIHVGRYISKGFSLGVAVSLNTISQVGEVSQSDKIYIGSDLDLRYSLVQLLKSKWFDPYVTIGGGYTIIGKVGNGTLNGGLGINLWFTDNIGVNLQSIYKHSFDDAKQLPHFQHALGLIIRFGGTDTDGDGIYDKDDACPETSGLKAFNGCPDTDGDGIKNSDDACPQVAGTEEMNGCPDTDGDGVIDSKDKCSKEKGEKDNDGCPWPDTDGDGVLDKDDNCPKVKGLKSNKGCPEVKEEPKEVITKEAQAKLDTYAKTIYFKSSKSTFKPGVVPQLDAIYKIMKKFPNANFSINGYTDSLGSNNLNKSLSKKRAAAVKDYLIGKGLKSKKLTSYGFGEENPIDSNKTSAGRANNRRVEIRLVK